MVKNWLLFSLFLLLTACAHHRHPASITSAPSLLSSGIPIQQTRCLGSFNKINVKGIINVNIHTGYKKPLLVLKGDIRDLVQVKSFIQDNTMYLIIDKGYPKFGPIFADIRAQHLNKLKYIGSGTIQGKSLHTNALDVFIDNNGNTHLGGFVRLNKLYLTGNGFAQLSGIMSPALNIRLKGNSRVKLQGVAHINRLVMDGNSWLSLYWVKSDYLRIVARKKAIIQLAGTTCILDVSLWDKAQFKGRYLRAQRAFVKTHGKSKAEISAVKHQSSLAKDASDIYYYNLSRTRADFMALNGSTLNMREWSPFDKQKMTKYNKQFP